MFGFFIEEKNIPLDIQKHRNELTSIRVGKVSYVLNKEKPSILPFKGKLPLVSDNSIDNYIDEISKYEKFEDLPRFLKNIVYKAEQIVYYNNRFVNFLEERNVSEEQFEEKNPKEKLQFLYLFLDEEQAEITILEIKDYE